MELFLLLIEASAPLVAAFAGLSLNAIMVVGDLLCLAVQAVVHLCCSGADGEGISPEAAEARRGRARRRRKWMFRVGAALLVLLVLAVAALAVANTFFFEPVLRAALRRVEARTGVAVGFDRAEGSFWSGAFAFDNLTLRREGHPQSDFDLRAESARVNLSVRDLARRRVVARELAVRGVRGAWTQTGRADKLRPRRPFRIDRFALDDAEIRYRDTTAERPDAEARLRLDEARAEPLRGEWLVADLLFGGQMRGAVDGAAFEVSHERGGDGAKRSLWRCDGLPATLLAAFVGAPFTWFDEGAVDLRIVNESDKGPEEAVRMDWRVVLRDFHARVPPGSSLTTRAAAAPVVAYLNRHRREVDLAFGLQLKKGDYRFASSEDLRLLAREALGQKAYEALRAFGQKVLDWKNAKDIAEDGDASPAE